MRIALISCDWKEEITDQQIDEVAKRVGGNGEVYFHNQDEVDSKVYFVSSEGLTTHQLDTLWSTGDLATEDEPFWEGTFDEIIDQLTTHIAEDC